MDEQPTRIAIAVVEHQGQFLVGERPPGVPLAGYWEFPGGKVGPDETPRQAAARECLEETGLAVLVGEEYGQVVHRYEHAVVELHFFACRAADAQARPRPPFRWLAREALDRDRFPPANAVLIDLLTGRGAWNAAASGPSAA